MLFHIYKCYILALHFTFLLYASVQVHAVVRGFACSSCIRRRVEWWVRALDLIHISSETHLKDGSNRDVGENLSTSVAMRHRVS